ncbi:MAG: sensor histidine kinase [Saprospiraceae bacterium]|nr:sensor histidine kinase [Saprospiraceae bacterium]
MRLLLIIGLCSIIWNSGFAQVNVDSLKQVVKTMPRDTHHVFNLMQIGNYYEQENLDSSEFYYRKALQLSKDINALFYEGRVISWFTDVLNRVGKTEEALQLDLRGLEIGRQLKHLRLTVASLANVANNYTYFANYDKALQYQLEALPFVEELKDSIYLNVTLNNIAGTYQNLRQYQKALPYAQRAQQIAQAVQDYFGEAAAYGSLGILQNKLEQHDKALEYFTKELAIAEQHDFKQIQVTALLNIGDQYRQYGEAAKGLPYTLRGIPIAEALGETEILARLLHSAGGSYYELYRYKEAQPLLKKAIDLSKTYQFRENLKETYLVASDVELALGNYDTSAYYRKAYRLLRDSLINEQVLANTSELETKYKTAQKQAEIERLQVQSENQQLRIRQRNGVILGMGGLLAMLGFISSLYYSNSQNKQKVATQEAQIQAQKIRQLEQEKQLSTVDAMLRGQEAERSRLARDLHDGLGGMLSGVRQTLNAMKGNQIVTEESARAFTRALDMLDTSISELRRVARNMMPEALVKFGLKDAVQDFTDTLNDSGAIQVQYQAFGLEKRLPEATEVIVFRIVQELLNNVVKHADANHVLLQLLQDGNRFHITVEDDGKGFDLQKLEEAPGIGWMNIRSRVNYLGGTLDVRSAPGQGTTVEIEFIIKELIIDEQFV